MTSNNCHNTNEAAGPPSAAIVLLEVATLLSLAAFLAWSHFAGRLAYFLAPAYLWLPPAAAVLVLAMALVRFVGLVRRRSSCHCEGHHASAGAQLFYAAIILGAVVAGGAVRPTQFSDEGMRKRVVAPLPRNPGVERAIRWVLAEPGAAGDAQAAAAVILPKDPTVLDVVTLANQSPVESLDGKFLSLVGQSAVGGSTDRFDLYRLVVNCCIADATAASIPVSTPPGTNLVGGWVRVDGTLKFDDATGRAGPFIQAASVKNIAEPREPYLQPR